MLKTLRLATLAAAVALALPAAAGFEYIGGEAGWQLAQHEYHVGDGRMMMSDDCHYAVLASRYAGKSANAPQAPAADGFEYVGGEAGWQVAQHKYDFVDGKFVMSDECDHEIRTALAPTPAEIESARRLSPGV